jgi:Zn-dependent protease with chaperone function
MHLVVYLPLAVPLLAAASARHIAGRLPPSVATWLLAGAAVALAAGSTAVLGLLALSAVIQIPLVAALGDMSLSMVRRHDPASLSAAIAAGVLLAAVTAAATRATWRRGRALASAARHARCLPGPGQLVVIPDGAADAYTLPGWPGRIVVTAGMLDALAPAERRVLLAHERAHAAGRHYLFTVAAYLAAAANPLLRPLAAAVTYTVERWADERAAADCGDRALAARAVARAALASAERPRSGRHDPARTGGTLRSAALGIAGMAAMRGAGPVPRRVAALLAPPPRFRPLLVAAIAALVLISGASVLDAAASLHAFVELAQAHLAS